MTDDWCSICDCSFNANKFTRHNHIPSSSFSSAINGSLSSSSQSSSSDEERKRSSTYRPLRSSLGHPNDYYTSKRIDQLHDRMDDIQIFSFVKFVNYHLSLKKSKFQINDIAKDLSNGHVLIDLIEIFSSTKLKREHGQTRFHSLTNVRHVLDYLQTHTEHVNISPQDIVSGNRKQILALLWIIMKLFDFPSFRLTNKNCFRENTLFGCGQDRSVILQWLNQILNQTLPSEQMPIRDFYLQTWLNGYYFSFILKYLVPLSVKHITVQTFEYLKELDQLKPYDKQSFHVCLNLCNHCFNTVTIIDYADHTERSLFKYFTELQQNVLILLKSNQIGKLIQNNPYTKQILETVGQTGHVSDVIRNNEQYLICMEDNGGPQNKLPNNSTNHAIIPEDLRIIERTSLFQRRNQCETASSDSHVTNGHGEVPEEERAELLPVKSRPPPQQLNSIAKKSMAKIERRPNDYTPLHQSLVAVPVPVEQPTVIDEKTEQITTITIETGTHEKVEEPSVEGRDPAPLPATENKGIQQTTDENIETSINKDVENSEAFIAFNHGKEHVKLDQSIDIAQEPEQVTQIAVQSTPSNEETAQMTVPNTDNGTSKIIEVQKAKQLFIPSEEIEGSTGEKEKLEQTIKLQDKIEQPAQYNNKESELLILTSSEEAQSVIMKIEELQQLSIELKEEEEDDDDRKLTREYQTLQKSIALAKENETSTTNTEQSKTEIKPSDQIVPTTTAEIDHNQQIITSTEVNNTSIIEDAQLERPSQSNYFGHSNEESKSHPPSKSERLNQELTTVPVKNTHPTVTNGELKHATTDQTSLSPVSHEEYAQNTIKSMKNETAVTSATKPERPTVKQNKSNKMIAPAKPVQQMTENKPPVHSDKISEPSVVPKSLPCLATNTTIVVNNHSIATNIDSKQSTTEKPPQSLISKGQTTYAVAENKPSIVKSKKGERSVVPRETPSSTTATNVNIHSSTTTNTKPTGTTKTSTQMVPSVEEKRHLAPSNEQRQITPEQPVHAATATTRGNTYSDVVTKQATKANHGLVQTVSPLKKNVTSSLTEESKQSSTSVEEAKPNPVASAIKRSVESKVALEKEGQPLVSVMKEANVSTISNEDIKQPSNRSKKSRRANAKKGKSTTSSVKIDCVERPIPEHEEEKIESLEIPLDLTNIAEEVNSRQIQSETLILSSNNDTPLQNENSPKSSVAKSRKNKKKKTIATTPTTLIEKSSPPLASIATTPNRNLFVVIKQFIHDPKSIAFKCIFILLCLCFSIILLVLSHK